MLGHSQTWITYNYICKTLHDLRVQSDVSTKIEWAKQDKLLQEYAQAS